MKDPIKVYESVITEEDAKAIIDVMEKKNIYDKSKVKELNEHVSLSILASGDDEDPGDEELKALDNNLFKIFHNIAVDYVKDWPEMSIASDEGYIFFKDSEGKLDDSKNPYQRGPYGSAVSVIIYLNDDYEGGELEFKYKDTKHKPKALSAVVFPASYEYACRSTNISKGQKFTVATWFAEGAVKNK